MKIGNTIKMFRIANGYTIKELAKYSGVSSAYISMVENSDRELSGKMLKKISGAFGVSISALTRISELSEQENWEDKRTLFEILSLYVKK